MFTLKIKITTIILIALYQNCYSDKDGVPLFVVDEAKATSHWNLLPDPLRKISSSYFGDIAAETTKRSNCIIIFLEEELCTEDLIMKDSQGTAFKNLRQGLDGGNVKYIPSISQPYHVLTHLFPKTKSNIYRLGSADQLELPPKYFKYLYVTFTKVYNETRIEALRHHDTLMYEVIQKVKETKRGPVIAFYTGQRNPVTIINVDFGKRKKSVVDPDDKVIRSSQAMFRLSGLSTSTRVRSVRFVTTPEVVSEHWTHDTYSVKMSYSEFELYFLFRFTDRDWMLDTVELIQGDETVGHRQLNIGSPWGRSYVCSCPIIVLNKRDGSRVTIPKYQIQLLEKVTRNPLEVRRAIGRNEKGGENEKKGINLRAIDLDETIDKIKDLLGSEPDIDDIIEKVKTHAAANPDDTEEQVIDYAKSLAAQTTTEDPTNTTSQGKFGPSDNCEPYFNGPILTGLFVSGILIIILCAGIMCMMDINSNGRYDDPNGREILSKADLAAN